MGSYLPISAQDAVWKDLPGFDDRYQVSDQGEVRRKAFRCLVGKVRSKTGLAWSVFPECTLKPMRQKTGPRVVLINEDHRRVILSVDYLVLSAFVGVESGWRIRHLDGDLQNNRLENLQWVNDGLIPSKVCRYKIKLTEQEATQAFTDMRDNAVVAAEIGISPLAVELIKRRIIWTQYTRHLSRGNRKLPLINHQYQKTAADGPQ